MKAHLLIGAVALGVVTSARATAAPPSTAARAAFEATARPTALPRLDPHVMSTHAVRPRVDELRRVVPGDTIELALSPGTVFTGTVDRVDTRGDDRRSIFGRIDGHAFILVLEADAMAATIGTPLGTHDLRYVGDGVHLVQRLDASRVEPCAGPASLDLIDGMILPEEPKPDAMKEVRAIIGELTGTGLPAGAGAGAADAGGPEGSCVNDLGEIVDVLVMWTPATRIAAGGVNAMRSVVQLAIDTVNLGVQNSDVGQIRWRLVWQGETDYDEFQSNDIGATLGEFTTFGGGMNEVFALRDAYGADQCVLLCEDVDGGAGIAWCTPTAIYQFSVVERWSVPFYTFAHELGHNQACDHDFENEGSGCGSSGSWGWRWTGDNGTFYRSIMSYAPGDRVPFYSNPNVFHQGQPTGTSNAHNAWTIDGLSTTTTSHRPNRFDLWVDLDLIFDGDGSFGDPYANLFTAVAQVPDVSGVGLPEKPTLHLKPADTNETGVIDIPCVLRACNGSVVIGQ